MPVWWGIFAYSLLVAAFGSMIYKNKQLSTDGINTVSAKENTKSIGLFFALATFILAVYFVGQRSWIFDTGEYQFAYDEASTDLGHISEIIRGNINVKGPGFQVLLILFKSITHGTYNDWFMFLAILQLCSIALFFYKYSTNFVFSVFLFIASGGFIWLVNGIRQFLAVTFILFFVDFIEKRKTVPFMIVVILAYFIHSSALLWIPFYFIINFKPWSKKFVLCSVFFTVVLFFLSTSSSFLSDFNYSYLSNVSQNTGVNPVRVLVMAIPAIIAFVGRKNIEDTAPPFINICINLSVVCTECYIVGMFTTGVVGRLPIYFQLFNWILLPWLIKNVFDENTRRIVVVSCVVGFLLYFYYDMYIKGNGIYHSTILNLSFDTV